MMSHVHVIHMSACDSHDVTCTCDKCCTVDRLWEQGIKLEWPNLFVFLTPGNSLGAHSNMC